MTASYATANGTATAGSDYVAGSGTVTFAPGVLTQTVSITVNGDVLDEVDETFVVNLTSPVNATIGDAQGIGDHHRRRRRTDDHDCRRHPDRGQ